MDPDLLRHLLATISYRFGAAVEDAPDGFDAFDPGAGVRTPSGLLEHCVYVLQLARASFEPGLEPNPSMGEAASWAERTDALRRELELLDAHVAKGTPTHSWTFAQMVQGPLSDVLTHIGQLALLRRLHGHPLARQSYLRAEIPGLSGGGETPRG